MNTTISTVSSLSKTPHVLAKTKGVPGSPTENFQNILAQAVQPKATAPIAAGAEQTMNLEEINSLLNEKKKKISQLQQQLIEEDKPSDSAEAEKDESIQKQGKAFLKGILEETGGPSKAKEDLTPKHYQGALPKAVGSSADLIAQLPNTPQNQANRNFQRRGPNAAVTQNQAGAPPQLAVAPFQVFLDKAVDFFQMVSDLENSSDTLMQDYVLGRASLEEVTLSKAKVGVALTYAMTIANQVTQTFKEILNMQV